MDFNKKVNEYKEDVKRVREKNKEIESLLFENFINVQFEVKNVRELFKLDTNNTLAYPIKRDAFYPILNVPEEFTKEKETFMPGQLDTITYKYILKDKATGNKIEICEKSKLISKPANNYIYDSWYVPNEKIEYTIIVEGLSYNFSRGVTYEEILPEMAALENNYSRLRNFIRNTSSLPLLSEWTNLSIDYKLKTITLKMFKGGGYYRYVKGDLLIVFDANLKIVLAEIWSNLKSSNKYLVKKFNTLCELESIRCESQALNELFIHILKNNKSCYNIN